MLRGGFHGAVHHMVCVVAGHLYCRLVNDGARRTVGALKKDGIMDVRARVTGNTSPNRRQFLLSTKKKSGLQQAAPRELLSERCGS